MNEDQLVFQLVDLTEEWNDYEDVPRSQQEECRKIGERLHDIGGVAAMREAYYIAKDANPHVTAIQAYWDGIGDWRW